MSRSVHFISKSIPGYGPADGQFLPCSGVSGRAVSISPNSSRGDYTLVSDVKFSSLGCGSRHTSFVCNASSSNYRRNPNFSRQNKHGFSRNKNRHNEDIDGYDDFEESEVLTSKNGPLLSFSGTQKFQATATPGPREKEIVELFRKVQVQLRERAAMKEGRKVEDSVHKEKSKESETVDSLLKLLRKHSVQQGKKNTNSARNRDFILDQPERVDPSTEESSTSISDSNSSEKHEMQESPRPHLTRPKSNFRRRSPVPEIKFQPVYSDSVSHDNLDSGKNGIGLQPEADGINQLKIESDVEPLYSEGNVFDEMSEDEISETCGSEHDNGADETNSLKASDLSGKKLIELRALAKSRGMKGFSKLKKSELIELLSESSF